jgi:hypothetical protein
MTCGTQPSRIGGKASAALGFCRMIDKSQAMQVESISNVGTRDIPKYFDIDPFGSLT